MTSPYTRWVPKSGLLSAIQSFTTWQAPYCVKSSQVRITFSYTNLCDMTTSITKIPKVEVQLLERGPRLHARYIQQYTRATFSSNRERVNGDNKQNVLKSPMSGLLLATMVTRVTFSSNWEWVNEDNKQNVMLRSSMSGLHLVTETCMT